MLALDLIRVIPVIGALKYLDEVGTLFKNADKVSVVARSTDGAGVLAKHADEAGAWLHGVKVFRYSDETAEAVASGEKLLKESVSQKSQRTTSHMIYWTSASERNIFCVKDKICNQNC